MRFESLAPQQLTLLLIFLAASFLLLTERIRIDLTAVFIILALAISGLLEPEQALSGFGSEPAVVVAAIFVLSEAVFRTGMSDRLSQWIGRLAGRSYNRAVVVIMLAVAGLAAVTHHVTITAVMLPVTLRLCREQSIAPSRLLMPLSFAASLGTTMTILGAPAFLIADGVLRQAGRPGLGIFTIAPIGLALTATGTAFMLLFGRFLLPDRKGSEEDQGHFRLNGYYTEIIILPESSLIGQTVDVLEGEDGRDWRVVGWLRHGRPRNRPFGRKQFQAGDVLMVRTTPEELAAVQEEPGLALHPLIEYGEGITINGNGDEAASDRLVQAVIAPGSELINRTVGQVNFLQLYGVVVVGLWRRQGWLRAELSRVRLHAGDVLVLLGQEDALGRMANDRSFLMLVPFSGEPQRRHKAPLAGGIMLATVLLAALNLLSIEIALLAGAAMTVLTGCLSVRQAYGAIDTRIYVFIAGAIPLGLAMNSTGTSELLATWLEAVVGGWPSWWVLLLLFASTAVVTQLMSDAATTALLAPVAAALAAALGQRPEPYVITVAMAAVASFLTPVGHHGNLLVYGPGRYRFSDFLLVGTPLTFLVALVVTLLAVLLWPN